MLACTSCATILSGTHKKVTFDSDHKGGATMIVDGRRYQNVKFPYKVNIKRGFKDSVVRITADGEQTVTMYIDKTFNPWSILNLADFCGWAIDVATGAITQPDAEYYWVEFKPSTATPDE